MDDDEARQALNAAAAALRDLSPLMRTIANLQLRSTQRNFQNQSFDGHAWPPLAESTVDGPAPWSLTKPEDGGPTRGAENILHPTGQHLLNRIFASSTRDEARVECPTRWAWMHQTGVRQFRLPQRPFMGITDADEQNIADAARHYIERALGHGV